MISTYLTRPVFQIEINWSDPVNKSWEFDLEPLKCGFGAEIFTGLREHVVQGYKVSVLLDTAAMEALDAFTAALYGRLRGFWLPAPFAAVQWGAAVGATHFDIEDQDLRSTLGDHPDVHLVFIEPDGSAQAAAISSVTLVSGRERVTVGSALNPQPNARTRILRLHYVRLADDKETGAPLAEGVERREFSVVEVPHEYAAAELGTRPIHLYHFWCDAPATVHWRYTSFAAGVVSGNELYTAAPLTHREIKQTVKLEPQSLELTAVHDPANPIGPLEAFIPMPPQRPMRLQILQVDYPTPDTQSVLFTGIVRSATLDGSNLRATADTWWTILKRKVPRLQLKPVCNWTVFDANCALMRAIHETTAEIVALSPATFPPTVTVDLLYTGFTQLADWTTEDWFAGGWLETGAGGSFECRTITASIETVPNRLVLSLNAPLRSAVVGQWIQLLPGCDGQAATCRGKFDNFAHFSGFVAIPNRNLSLKGLNENAAQGAKK